MSKLLVVVDYQKDFVDGALGFPGAENLDDGILALVKEYVDAGDSVLFTQDTHDENYLQSREGKALPIEHCILGTEGHQIYGKTGHFARHCTRGNLYRTNKFTFGVSPEVFVGMQQLHMDFTEITIVGLVTNMCVISNIACFQAAYPNAQMIVESSLVDSFDKELHQKALDVMRGMQVIVK